MSKMSTLAMEAAETFMKRHPKVPWDGAMKYIMNNKDIPYWIRYIRNGGTKKY